MKLSKMRWQSNSSPILRPGFTLGLALLLAGSAAHVQAFSLLGPGESWMTPQLGYAQPGDIGGPMNLGEEYRWNVPVLTYAFDQSFLDYFGSRGVAAVESAIGILNGLPPASQADPTTYPTNAVSINYQAQAEGLCDLKSQTLALLLEQLGLAAPTRFTYCLRNFAVLNGEPTATVIQRNYAPDTLTPSAQVNDVRYGYSLVFSGGTPPTFADAVEYPIDPNSSPSPAVADGALTAGWVYNNLTRDDVGGLRYLLGTNNFNPESLLPEVQGAGINTGDYVNFAPRPGVDKIVFVRPGSYDFLFGQFAVPYTNQFVDSYLSNSVLCQQQLERVLTQPDILFSAANLSTGAGPAPRFTRTGTTNWLSFAALGASGPGVIQPQVRITFHKAAAGCYLQTADSPTNGATLIEEFQDYHWGSFDDSTNPPVVYPAGSAPLAANQLALQLELDSANSGPATLYAWQLPVSLGGLVTIQTSTNLSDWAPLLSITNHGQPLLWRHAVSHPQRYFRVAL